LSRSAQAATPRINIIPAINPEDVVATTPPHTHHRNGDSAARTFTTRAIYRRCSVAGARAGSATRTLSCVIRTGCVKRRCTHAVGRHDGSVASPRRHQCPRPRRCRRLPLICIAVSAIPHRTGCDSWRSGQSHRHEQRLLRLDARVNATRPQLARVRRLLHHSAAAVSVATAGLAHRHGARGRAAVRRGQAQYGRTKVTRKPDRRHAR
jgi:hypothetical protein